MMLRRESLIAALALVFVVGVVVFYRGSNGDIVIVLEDKRAAAVGPVVDAVPVTGAGADTSADAAIAVTDAAASSSSPPSSSSSSPRKRLCPSLPKCPECPACPTCPACIDPTSAEATAGKVPTFFDVMPHCKAYNKVLEFVDRDVNAYSNSPFGGITKELITATQKHCKKVFDDRAGSVSGCFTITLHGGRSYVHTQWHGFQSRNKGSKFLLYDALIDLNASIRRAGYSHWSLPDTEFVVSTADWDEGHDELPLWRYDRPTKREAAVNFAQYSEFTHPTRKPTDPEDPNAHPHGFLMPDFTFYSWPEAHIGTYDQVLEDIDNAAKQPFDDRARHLWWRGNTRGEYRGKSVLRLKKDAAAAGVTPPVDIETVLWDGHNDWFADGLPVNAQPLHAACNQRYLLHSEGIAGCYSSRLKYLLRCGSLLFVPKMAYEEYWYPLLTEDVTHVSLSRFLEDALPRLRDVDLASGGTAMTNAIPPQFVPAGTAAASFSLEKQKEMAIAGQKVVRDYLNPEGVRCYTQYLIWRYAHLTKYNVTKPENPTKKRFEEDMLLRTS